MLPLHAGMCPMPSGPAADQGIVTRKNPVYYAVRALQNVTAVDPWRIKDPDCRLDESDDLRDEVTGASPDGRRPCAALLNPDARALPAPRNYL